MNVLTLQARRSPLPYLLSLAMPLLTTAFFLVPGQRGWLALAWLATLVGIAVADELLAPLEQKRADGVSLARLADLVALLQLANAILFVLRVGDWDAIDTTAALILMGVGGAFSSMIAAHELIHRPQGVSRSLGRWLLWTVLYDQFFTDHLRGHHRTVGTSADALTARRDETFSRYLARSWRAELRSAWRIEVRRHAARGPLSALLANQLARGLAAQAAVLGVIALLAGPAAGLLLVAQAALTHVLVGAVNFVEHWGIVRGERKVGAADAWDSTAPLSHYALLGLSFHSDHHVRAATAFDRLELQQESPRLPRGYFTMVAMVLLQNERARRLLEAELDGRAGPRRAEVHV